MIANHLSELRNRLRYLSWHRGIRENDLILGKFADLHLAELDLPQLQAYGELLEANDLDLYEWMTQQTNLPEPLNTPIHQEILTKIHRLLDQ